MSCSHSKGGYHIVSQHFYFYFCQVQERFESKILIFILSRTLTTQTLPFTIRIYLRIKAKCAQQMAPYLSREINKKEEQLHSALTTPLHFRSTLLSLYSPINTRIEPYYKYTVRYLFSWLKIQNFK